MNKLKHLLRSQQFSRDFLEHRLFPAVDLIRLSMQDKPAALALSKKLAGRILLSLFFEPSSRTRFSFEIAATRLGMATLSTENAEVFSSFAKGESLEDGIKVLSSLGPDIIVMRHYQTGSVERAAAVSRVPIINAGDGMGQHPTQALLDLYTIKRELGQLDDLTVMLGGDLAFGRTVRSLAYLLSKFQGTRFIFVSPPQLQMGQDIKNHLTAHGIAFEETENPAPALASADVIYWTRTQKERMDSESAEPGLELIIGRREMSRMKPSAILLHPLPRNQELRPECDSDPRAAYFRQAENGLYVRAALLDWLLTD